MSQQRQALDKLTKFKPHLKQKQNTTKEKISRR